MPEGARKWFGYTRLTAGIMAAGHLLIGLAGVFLTLLLVLGIPEESSEPWRARDSWVACILCVWLVALPMSLLIFLSLVHRNRRYLYVCTLLLLLTATAQVAFVLYGMLSLQLPLSLNLVSLLIFVGWLVALYLINVVWSKVRLAKRSIS